MPTSVSKDLPLPVQAPLSWRQRLGDWLSHFFPSPLGINGRERLRVTVGIGLGASSSAVVSAGITAVGAVETAATTIGTTLGGVGLAEAVKDVRQ